MGKHGEKLLTEAQVRNAAAGTKMYRLRDGGGLFLQIEPGGRRWWTFRYTLAGRASSLSLGDYPTITLRAARAAASEFRKQRDEGTDPAQDRRKPTKGETFAEVVQEWVDRFSPGWSPKYGKLAARWFELYLTPHLGERPMKEITSPELLAVLRRVESMGKVETAHRLRAICGQLWRYGIATGRCERDVAHDLRGALPPAPHKSMATLTDPTEIGGLLRNIDAYGGEYTTRAALQLAPMLMLRPNELRQGRWSEIDLDAAEWRIPVERMKARQTIKDARAGEVAHIVPLPQQAVEILRQLQPLTGDGDLVFPGVHKTRPLSEQTMLFALRRIGYTGEEQTVHGFRAMASTLLHELGFDSDLIEKQLAHADRNKIRARYNHADRLADRRKMLQAWADYLDQLRAGNGDKVVPIRRAGA